ncbi:MAG: choice-of-anchor J domain-containing protein, partial [Bacteroidales bacterium]|nr:choice-of-anchor J domain-containing protein [Bacteroidales bacterium]
AHAQSKPIKPDQNELSAIEETAVLFDQGQLTPNRDLRSPVCPSGNLSEGFEGTIFPPAGWKVINGGDANTWTRYTSTPITGTASAAIGYGSTAHNDWLISPRVVPQAGNATFSFMAKNGSSYFIEEFNVKLSTTGSEQADFTVTLASNVAPPTVATLYSYDLSAYNGQAVYIAVQAISTDEMRLYVDDFSGPALYAPYFASDGSVDFGVTFDLGSYSEDFEIANCSAGNLELDFLSASPEVTVTGLPLTIATGATGTITVNFNPSALGPYNGNFQLTTNDPENPTFQTTVVSTVKKAVVTTSIFENFDSYTGFSVPANWGGDFSTRTTGGLNNTARFTKNLWGTGSSMTGQFYTNFVDMADDGILSFSYRAVNYSSYPNTPTPAASFEFVVWISTDFGINFTPIYVCDATTHTASTQYAFVDIDLSAYSGETAIFIIEAERFADDFYLDFDDFSVSFVQPGLQFMAAEVLMGERPIGAWMKPAALGIMNNPGKGSFTFNAVDLDNNYDGFLSAVSPALPFVLNEGDFTEEFGIRTNNTAVAPGAFSGSLAFFYEPTSTRAASVIPFSGFAYTPVNGDVWEKAFTVSSVTFPVTVAKGDFRDNYDLPGATDDGWDVVYKIVASANDMLATISLTGTDAKMAVYPANFGGLGGPDTDNALASATTSVTGLELYQGTYYLVVSATGANYTLNYTPTVMPSPVAVTNLTPADGAVNIINGNNLTWSWGTNTLDYRVVLGTTYPPATVVKDWATANTAVNGSYTLAGLNPNLQYFWRIDTRNNNGTTSGDVWGFTTTITPPSALAVTVNDPGESATTVSASLTWTGPTNRAFIGYNVYRGGVKITPTPITNASFTDLGLARNITYSYTVKSVYDEGESAASNTVSITTKGVGTFNGFVYDALTSAPIEGATVKITGSAGDYTVTTTANGAYSTLAYKGSYNFTVSATDYNSQTVSNVSLNHGATVSRNFYLSETPFPVGEVIAFELNDNSTQVSWSGTAPSPIELVKLTQNPGLPENAYYEYFDMGYGVVYDLLAYPDASISSMNFHHASWGTYGTWQYKIHVYNWDTKTLIGTYGPFNTTGNDKWESGVNLGNVSAGGAGLVAIIMEPLGNVYDDAFPNLSSDNDVVNPQGSIFGELNDPAGMATSTIGNFLMELYIYTAQGTRATAPRYVDFGKAVNAPNRMNTTAEASKPVINQTSLSITKGEETFTNRTVVGPSYCTDATRGIVSYDVWREKAFQPGALVKIGNTFSEDFVDFDWGNMG